MEIKESKENLTRRSVLKTMGTGSIALASFPAAVSGKTQEFNGIYYDTLTQEVGGTTTGHIKRKQSGYQGTIDIAGFSIPLDQLSTDSSERFTKKFTEGQYNNDGDSLQFELKEHTDSRYHYSGTITRQSPEYGRLGYYLVSDADYDPQVSIEANSPDPNWKNHDADFRIPNKGIPTDSGSKRLSKLGKNSNHTQQADRVGPDGGDINTMSGTTKVGMLDNVVWSGSLPPNSCNNTTNSHWKMAAGISAKGNSSEDWDQIEESNVWKFFTHFKNRPENLYGDFCPDDNKRKPLPDRFNYYIHNHRDEGDSVYYNSWEPRDNDGNSGNGQADLILDILGGVGGIYTAIGTAVVKYLIDGNSVDVSLGNNNTEITFDVPLAGGYNDLPHKASGKARTAEVSLRVNNEYSSGYHSVIFVPKYTFQYDYTDENSCDCDYTVARYKTVSTSKSISGTFEGINQ